MNDSPAMSGKVIKTVSWINIIGFTTTSLVLILYLILASSAWGDLFLTINLGIGIPVVAASLVTRRNAAQPRKAEIQNTLKAGFLLLWLPSLGLPLAYEWGGVLISAGILGLGLWITFGITDLINKMLYLNVIGLIFLVLSALLVIATLGGNL